MNRWIAVLILCAAVTSESSAQVTEMELMLGKIVPANTPVIVPLSLNMDQAKFKEVTVEVATDGKPARTLGQLTSESITTESIKAVRSGLTRRDLHVVLPAAGSKLIVRFEPIKLVGRPLFVWTEKKEESETLSLKRTGTLGGGTPYVRYMNRPYDPSSKEAREKSYKVFHHLYDPAGKTLVTNGGHTDENIADPKKLLFPHHRGIMYGFNKCYFGPDMKTQADTWHCPPADPKKKNPTAHVAHQKTISQEAGPVLGRHRVLLGWYGADEKPFALEERELTVYNVQGGKLVEFASRLKTTGGKIKVDGDPQHAGFQFRAANSVGDNGKKETYYLHPDGSKGDMGKERNWPQDKGMVDLPWYAVSFVIDGQRYSACYLNHPNNPKETRFSERYYARFGGYFERVITEDNPLVVNYRLWLQNGEMTVENGRALYAAFAGPAK